jgi:hypothetical protein
MDGTTEVVFSAAVNTLNSHSQMLSGDPREIRQLIYECVYSSTAFFGKSPQVAAWTS